MRILIISPLFQPEPNHLKGLAFAQELVRRGHEVEVLTCFPNYPGGKIYPGYRQRWYQRETMGGVAVIRVPIYPDHSNSGFRRILCYLSLAFSTCIPGLFLARRPDVVHVYQGSATLALPAMLLRLLRGIPYILDVQDLWPESVTSSGMLKPAWMIHPLHMWCNLTYRLAKKIVVLSPGYKTVLADRGVPAAKIEVVYNWCDERQMPAPAGVCPVAAAADTPPRFTVIYAGNLGRVQALETVVAAAALLDRERPDILFLFIGDGIDGERLKALAKDRNLKNVQFLPRQPAAEVNVMLKKADALLIHLRDDPLCRVGIPQKTQAYLAAGRPIIIGVRGDAADLVAAAQAGVSCPPENPELLAAAIKKLHDLPFEEREKMGRNGVEYYTKHLAFNVGVERMRSIFEETAR